MLLGASFICGDHNSSNTKFTRLKKKKMQKRKKCREKTQWHGWHFESLDRFACLNKSNGAHPHVERVSERKERHAREEIVERWKVSNKKKQEKRRTMPILPLAVAFGIVASASCLSREGIGCDTVERERIRIYRDLPHRSLVNVLLSVCGTEKIATCISTSILRLHT